jgi:acetoacetate decarboxylase
MKPDPSKHYRMPLIMGPMFDLDNRPKWAYPQVEILAFQYLTEKSALEALLPDCYRPAKEPLVTVLFSQNNGLDFMAGGGYRMAAFQIAVRFDGDQDHVEGDLILVMLENQTWPILGGREDLGVPKLFADISPIRGLPDGSFKGEASLWGHPLFSLEIPPMKVQLSPVRVIANRRINSRPWLGYKYIPSLDGPPDAEYPTISQNDTKIEKLWLGKSAKLQFGSAGAEDIAHARPLLDALSTLSIAQPVQALYFKGSSVLRYDLSRRLR